MHRVKEVFALAALLAMAGMAGAQGVDERAPARESVEGSGLDSVEGSGLNSVEGSGRHAAGAASLESVEGSGLHSARSARETVEGTGLHSSVCEPTRTERTHIVADNETLTGLALRYYCDAGEFRLIGDANAIDDPNLLPVNIELRIPAATR